MKPTWAWERDTWITHIPPFFVICSNSYARMLDRCSHSCASMPLTIVEGIRYDISRTQQELYPVWRLVPLGIRHKSCVWAMWQPHSIGGVWAEQQLWCFLLRCMCKHIILLWIHNPVKDCYWSNHPYSLSDHDNHCAGIQLTRKHTYSLY